MKITILRFFLALACIASAENQTEDALYNLTYGGKLSPMEKVMQMLEDLRMKVINEEKEAYILYAQRTALCDKEFQATSFLIQSDSAEIEELRAEIAGEMATIGRLLAKVSELTTKIATNTRELSMVRHQREAEEKLFAEEIKELKETISDIKQAIAVLQTEKGQALLQTTTTKNVANALKAMVQASMISFADATRLTALVQTNQEAKNSDKDDDDDAVGAPWDQPYERQDGGIIDTLSDLQDKAETQLKDAERSELLSRTTFAQDEKSLMTMLENDKGELDEIRGDKSGLDADAAEKQGDLVKVKDLLTIEERTLKMSEEACKDARDKFLDESRGREEEVIAVIKAEKALGDATGVKTTHDFNASFAEFTHGVAPSFLQTDTKNVAMKRFFAAVNYVRELGKSQQSSSLTQLAMRLTNAVREHDKQDPFRKVKGLIKVMIEKLEAEASDDATRHEYCVKHMSEAEKNIAEKKKNVMIIQGKLSEAEARLAFLMRELKEIDKSNVLIGSIEAKEGEIRNKEQELYEKTKKANEQAMEGCSMAINELNKFYGREDTATTQTDAAHSIVELLELIKTDLEKTLAALEADNNMAQKDYDKSMEENKLAVQEKNSDETQKRYQIEALKGKIANIKSNLADAQAALDSAWEEYEEIKEYCTDSADQLEERIRKVKLEVEGLTNALDILNGEVVDMTTLVQERSPRSLRGLARH